MVTREPNADAAVLAGEAEWLETAYANASQHPNDYSAEYLAGFKTAAGWVRFHADHPHLLEPRRHTTLTVCSQCGRPDPGPWCDTCGWQT